MPSVRSRERIQNAIIELMREAAKHSRAYAPIIWIAERIGLAPEGLRRSVWALNELVEPWIHPDHGPCLVFTPLGVATLGIVFRERQHKRKKSRVITEADLWELSSKERDGLNRLEDAAAAPIELHGPEPPDLDEAQRYRYRKSDYLAHPIPQPTVLLGERLQWPVAGQETFTGANVATGPCVGCGDVPRDWEYCLICWKYPIADRMLGLDRPRRNGGKRPKAA